MSLGRENSSTIEAWQAEFIPPATCQHCKRNDHELHEYDGLRGLWCEDCADLHINNEQELTSPCCGARVMFNELCTACGDQCGPGECAACQ